MARKEDSLQKAALREINTRILKLTLSKGNLEFYQDTWYANKAFILDKC